MNSYTRRFGLMGLVALTALVLICKFWLNVIDAKEYAFSNSVLVGQVTELEGSRVTLRLGRLSVQKPPAKPDDDEPPNKPEDRGEPPAKPSKSTETERTMQLQTEDNPKATSMVISKEATDSQPDMLLLNNNTEAKGQAAGADKPNEIYSFEAGEDTAILDLSGAAVYVEEHLQTREGSLADIALDSVLELEIGEKNLVITATVKNIANDVGGSVAQGEAANLLATDGVIHGKTYTSKGDDENALRVDGASVSLTDVVVRKSGGASSNTENGDFYGQNAALLATNGALLTIDKAKITSNALNGNGVFSYGKGTVISISDSSIETSGDNSGGLQTTGGATMNAVEVQVETAGNSSAAIRSDRGGGTVNVIGGSYISRGFNSPAVYSTADITVMNASLTAENSEALVIEGKNSLALLDCTVSGNMSADKGSSSDENVHNVMIYQSMSGDAEVGTSEFSAQGGSISAHSGDMFYVTNTHCRLTLDGVGLQNEGGGQLLRVCGNSARCGWGTAGENGAQVEFLAKRQEMTGDITVDSISSLDLQLTGGSVFTGSLNIVPNAQGASDEAAELNVYIDEDSIWNLTGDCVISSLENNGSINYNGYKLITGGLKNN